MQTHLSGVVSLKVLLVEDDPIAQKVQAHMLCELGCKVESVETGEDALKKLMIVTM